MELYFSSKTRDRRFPIDWGLVVTSLAAIALLTASIVRVDVPQEEGMRGGSASLNVLDDRQHLVALEDFTFGTHAWTLPARMTSGVEGRLGPFRDGYLSRRIQLPDGTAELQVSFDFFMHGSDNIRAPRISVSGTAVEAVSQRQVGEGSLHVTATILDPGDDLVLTLEPPAGAEAWSLDNFVAIATTR